METENSKRQLNNISEVWSRMQAWPWATLFLVWLQIVVFVFEEQAANVGILGYMIDDYDFNWAAFVGAPLLESPRLISHTLFHADLTHLVSNVLFFIIFGPTVEKKMGGTLFFIGYFVWGALAALTQGFFSPFSEGLIGASGAISGSAGAFFVLYPLKTPPIVLQYVVGRWVRSIPAFFWIGLWFIDQVRRGYLSLLPQQLVNHVSLIGYWAHIGGFAAGAIVIFPFILLTKSMQPNRGE